MTAAEGKDADRSIVGWRLPDNERRRLLERFPAHYSETVADHVTLRFGTDAMTMLPEATRGDIVGEVDDGCGVHALVVAIGGTTVRGDGSHYHITWSLGPGRRAKESNDVIAAIGWQALSHPLLVVLEPARWTATSPR